MLQRGFAYLPPAAQAASHWQVSLADAVLSVAVGLAVAIVARSVVAAVSVSALIVIACTYVASRVRGDTFTIAAPKSAAGCWVILAEELLVAAALFGAAVSALRAAMSVECAYDVRFVGPP